MERSAAECSEGDVQHSGQDAVDGPSVERLHGAPEAEILVSFLGRGVALLLDQ